MAVSDQAFIHPTAVIDDGAEIGAGTKIWHFVHVMPGARIGADCVVGQGCYVGNVAIGDRVKLQNNVSVYDGVTLEDEVFCGPSCVFTNVVNPRAAVDRKSEYQPTRVGRGATIGANATIVCPVDIGVHAFIAAGAVITADVEPFALMVGVPGRCAGWMCTCGEKLPAVAEPRASGVHAACERCERVYRVGPERVYPVDS
jgi:UDP-2-acetamido-3-amino-2,3-dideoxy-glucuronate N-acetyltransferase